MSNNTSNETLREETTVFADTTTQTTSTEIKSTSTVTGCYNYLIMLLEPNLSFQIILSKLTELLKYNFLIA